MIGRLNLLTSTAFLALVSICLSCGGGDVDKNKVNKNVLVEQPLVIPPLAVDTIAIDSFLAKHSVFTEFTEDFKQFYRAQNYVGVWFDKQGLIEAAQHLANLIHAQKNDGVLKKLSYSNELFSLFDKQKGKHSTSLALELMLTAQYFSYAKNKWGGASISKAKDIGWYLPGKKLSYAVLLKKQLTISSGDVEQDAVIPQYIALRKMLNRYQELERKAADVLVPENDSLQLTKVRERLFQLGDLSKYDGELADAILSFKGRHGLQLDTSISKRFIKELNIPLRSRIEQMIINLERMRWIPLGDHGGKFILVNIPAYQLYYYQDNKLDWSCKVVVGKEMSQTVIFSGKLQYIVFSPYWYVPQSIINKEILPAMKKDPSYLNKHQMDWNNGQIRQRPGPENSLGAVKFIFPNANNIYLHDTPSKPLFNEQVRAFSHGCIRVSEPEVLAIKLLEDMPSWNTANIDRAMKRRKEQWVTLKTKIPVYIGYFTAYVDSSGKLNFREDIYHRDKRLLEMLME